MMCNEWPKVGIIKELYMMKPVKSFCVKDKNVLNSRKFGTVYVNYVYLRCFSKHIRQI
jgi:hypothetical protein